MRPRYQRQLAGQDVDDDLIVRRAGYPFVAGVRESETPLTRQSLKAQLTVSALVGSIPAHAGEPPVSPFLGRLRCSRYDAAAGDRPRAAVFGSCPLPFAGTEVLCSNLGLRDI